MRSGDISVDRDSDVSIRRQITDQVLFLIATGRLRSGEQLPSVRELARRHDIHANTVSQAYGELVDSHWLKRHRGRRLEVRSAEEPLIPREEGLDDLINATILAAREKGYSLQQLEDRVRHRLLVEPPDHVLVVTRTVEMGKLLRSELSESAPFAVETCLLQEFLGEPRVGDRRLGHLLARSGAATCPADDQRAGHSSPQGVRSRRTGKHGEGLEESGACRNRFDQPVLPRAGKRGHGATHRQATLP